MSKTEPVIASAFEQIIGKDPSFKELPRGKVPPWNSLSHVMLIIEVEKKTNTKLGPYEYEQIQSYRDLIKIFESKMKEA